MVLKILSLQIIFLLFQYFGHAKIIFLKDTSKKYSQNYYLELTHLKRKKQIKIFVGDYVSIDYLGTKMKGYISNIQEDFIEIIRNGITLKIEIKSINRIQRISLFTNILRIFGDIYRFIFVPLIYLMGLIYFVFQNVMIGPPFPVLDFIIFTLGAVGVFFILSLPYIIGKNRFSKRKWVIKSKKTE